MALDTGNTTAGENNMASLEKKPKQREREEIRRNRKEREGKEKKDSATPSVSAVIANSPPSSTSDVPTVAVSETICFYIACGHK